MSEAICSHCKFPIHPEESGARHFGTYTAHSENRCLELLRTALEESEARRKEQEQLFNVARLAAERRELQLCQEHNQLRKQLAKAQKPIPGCPEGMRIKELCHIWPYANLKIGEKVMYVIIEPISPEQGEQS